MPAHTTINATVARMLLPFICTEETRYYLCGISIEPHPNGGALCIATNGHVMGLVHDVDAICDRKTLVSVAGLKKLAKKPAQRDQELWLSLRNEDRSDNYACLIQAENAAEACEADPLGPNTIEVAHQVLIEGTFPDWQRLFPRAETPMAVGFPVKCLGKILAHIDKLESSPGNVAIHASADGAPACFRFDGPLPPLFALVMPLWKGREITMNRYPEFLAPFLPAGASSEAKEDVQGTKVADHTCRTPQSGSEAD